MSLTDSIFANLTMVGGAVSTLRKSSTLLPVLAAQSSDSVIFPDAITDDAQM
jgi:hypothetical protein